jgi:hypothetical protein
MTEPRDFLLDTPNGQRSITIDPINITASEDILYSTGQYDLKEGDVGIGVITFTSNKDWTFDGVGDINDDDVKQIARFIMQLDSQPAPLVDSYQESKPVTATVEPIPSSTHTLSFIVEDGGKQVDVHIEIYNQVYSVTMGGKSGIQLEQDHHGNWYVTKGQLNDALVPKIGERITAYIMEQGTI